MHSYILSSVLPFSDKSNNCYGFNCVTCSFPQTSGLVLGEVSMGVCPVLPIEGMDIILGNGLAGSRMRW